MLRGRRWFFVALPIFVFWFFGQIDKVGISVIQTNPEFLEALGLVGDDRYAKIGMLTFAFTISYAFANLFWGYTIDRLGARKVAIFGVSIWAVTMISSGLSNTYEMFLLSRIILGFGEGVMIPVSGKFISAWFNKREIGRAQASWISGNYLGPALGTIMLVLIISSFHWQAAFFVLAAINIFIVIPLFIFLTRNRPEDHPFVTKEELAYIREVEEDDKAVNIKNESDSNKQSFLSNVQFWIVFFGMLVASFLFFGISIWLPTYLLEVKGFEKEGMTSITSMSWLFALIFVIICGFLADKTGRPHLMATVLFAITATFLTIAIFIPNPIFAGICMGISMGAQGGVFHLSNMLVLKYSTPETAGRAAGLIGFTNIMGGVSSYIMGWLRDISGGEFTSSIIMLIVVASLGAVAHLLAIRKEGAEIKLSSLPHYVALK